MNKGIVVPISRLNTLFTSNLWTGNTYTKYGRIYRNVVEGGIIPEAYNATTGAYSDTLLDDNVDALSFYDVQPTETYSSQFVSTVWICFAVNLVALYPTVTTERATEYAHEDALKEINKTQFKVTGLVRGREAFSDYEKVKTGDSMNQYHLFRFNTEVKYPQNC